MEIVSKQKARVFRIVLVLLPLMFFGASEGVLRLADYGGDLSLFRETMMNGKAYYGVNPDVTNRYFRSFQVKALMSNELFEKKKRAETYRIFCLGESSTLGYPYMYNGSFPTMLRERLQSVWPEKNIEVINLGITAVSSYTVADFVHELVRYQPDALLVYCGHNEFYGALGVASTEALGRSRWAIRAYLSLEHLRTFRLIRDGITAIGGMLRRETSGSREATVMEGMVGKREIELGSEEYKAAKENFKANLEEIAETANSHNVRLVFGTLVSNLSGMSPFVSAFSLGLGPSGRSEYDALVAAAKLSIQRGETVEAGRALSAAITLDSMAASGHFLLAKVLEDQGQYGEALSAFKAARDLDALRFRAPTEFNTVIHEVALKHGIAVAESEQLVATNSQHGIIGNQFVVEHVHLNVDGYFLIAKSFFTAMVEGNVLASTDQWHLNLEKKDSEYRAEVGVTALDSVMASIRLFVLTNSWPFREGGRTLGDFEAKTELERLGKSCLLRELTWEQAHVKAAETYESRGDVKLAADEYHALAVASPLNASPLLRLGQLRLNSGDDEGAKAVFTKSLKLGETFHACQGIGFVHLRKNEFGPAAEFFGTALQHANGIPISTILETREFLAVALAGSGKLSEAESVAQAIVASSPEQARAKDILNRIRMELRSKGVNQAR
jgi:tetratricopeptide (TPR) repeat protein